jgi:membrane fusion protein, multidrug efflux system
MIRWMVVVFCVILAGCGKKSPPAESASLPSVPVRTASTEVRTVPLFFEAMGIVKPFHAVEIRPQVSGIIAGVHFHDGQWVEQGDLLYTIEETAYAIKVQEMKAVLLQDQAHLKNAQKKLKRYESLSSQDLIAQVEWDEVKTQVALYRAIVKADQARLAAAELELQHCRIDAPISGYAGKTARQQGNMADASVLVTISNPEPYYVDFSITEKELQRLGDGDLHVEVYLAGEEVCVGCGEVVFLDSQLDAVSGVLPVRAMISSPSKPLWTGQSVRVHLIFGEKKDALLIPLKAIKTNQKGPYVFAVKDDGTAETIPVTLGPEEKGWIVIEEGLNNVSKVVIEGQNRLFPGSKIEEVR